MKKLALATLALTCAAGAFAQGTVTFNNRVTGAVITHVYAPLAGNIYAHKTGNGSSDTASGTTDWTGYGLVGVNLAGQYGASTTFAQLLGANGAGQPEGSLTARGQTTTFRTGGAAGNTFGITDTLEGITKDSAAATLEMVAWDNSSGQYSTWAQASVAWTAGLIAAGWSGALTVNAIGGDFTTPPNLVGLQSFNLYFNPVPEPTSFALAGLGAAAMLIMRRRK